VTAPSADAFAALARSSPWLWSTLRFTERRGGPNARAEIRAWLRRPDMLRVETAAGGLIQVVRDQRQRGPQDGLSPILRPDGLVDLRPDPPSFDAYDAYDAPMFQDYFWIAMLDPVELADGRDWDSGGAAWPALDIDEVTEVEHAGRPAWEAVVRPTDVYEPRCGCCPLLRTRRIDVLEYRDHPQHVLAAYPDAFRVRLDVETGVCVFTEQLGGLTPGAGHEVRIEAVDEPMDDALFDDPRPLEREIGWSQYPGPT
jgi:hypothetical protein